MNKTKNQRIRVKLTSFNHELLVASCKKMIELIQCFNVISVGMVCLPTKKRIYCVLRSPHVDKDSREHFEVRVHKRLLEIYTNPNSHNDVVSLLSDTDLPSGILYQLSFS